jgi:glycosyltransferase involved in cell wall biosynthesis
MATLALDVRLSTPGGGKTYIESLVPELVRQGGHRILLVRAAGDGLRLPDLEVLRAPSAVASQILWSQTTLASLLRAKKVDVYHSLKHPGPVVTRARSVFTLRAAGPFDGLYPLPLPELLYWSLLGRMYLRRVDHVIAVSRFVARSLPPDLAPGPDRLDVIPHGLPESYRPEPPAHGAGPGPVLAVGNMVEVKNFTTLVRAYAALPLELREMHPLVIAGDNSGSEADRIRTIASAVGVRDQLHLVGYLPPHALRLAYVEAELFVLSSLQESFSFALLEAMASGLPCVVTDCGGPTEVGGDAVSVVRDARDVRSMTAAMERLLRDPVQRRGLGAQARARALSFTWEETARRTLEVYARVLARPRGERA